VNQGIHLDPSLLYRLARGPHEHTKLVQKLLGQDGDYKTGSPLEGRVVPGKTPDKNVDNKKVPMQSGEYVIPTDAVKAIGKENLDKMVMSVLGKLTPPSGSPSKGFRRGGFYGQRYAQNAVNPSAFPSRFPGNMPDYPFGIRDPNVQIARPAPVFTHSWEDFGFKSPSGFNPWVNAMSRQWYGTAPFAGAPQQTAIPTYWNPQGIPYAVPAWVPTPGDKSRHTPEWKNQ
jgi:hypothetical protein